VEGAGTQHFTAGQLVHKKEAGPAETAGKAQKKEKEQLPLITRDPPETRLTKVRFKKVDKWGKKNRRRENSQIDQNHRNFRKRKGKYKTEGGGNVDKSENQSFLSRGKKAETLGHLFLYIVGRTEKT